MQFAGKSLTCSMREGGVAELLFDLQGESVNKLSRATLAELKEVVGMLETEAGIKGLLIGSGKEAFLAGADITEFIGIFSMPDEELYAWLMDVHKLFSRIEDLPFPTVTAINGFAMGGGVELALSTCYRLMTTTTRIGVPETKLGIFPGWGGTIRLARVAGADNAIEWIASGDKYDGAAALRIHAVDGVVAPEMLREAALAVLTQAIEGRRDWRARRAEKIAPLKLSATEAAMVFEGAKGFIGAKAGPNYPAPLAAIEVLQESAGMLRDEALATEARHFVRIAKTPTAFQLVNLFLGDQYVAKVAKKTAKPGAPVQTAAVLGAGIMGGGIAYQSASRGTAIIMKDIAEKALDLGLAEAEKLMVKRVEQGKLAPGAMAKVLNRIRPTLSFGDFQGVDLVVEAVVENEKVKKAVLADLEDQVRPGTVLASNTSTISISRLATDLKRPENFCGIHFFNPVHRMPLVEVIRGRQTSDATIATAVGYCLAMGKTPIVVNDCAGFLVNRVLFPYFYGFNLLVSEGVDFQRIDKVMTTFGWPMGPAYLLDVVGIDTAHHADAVMAQAFPDRMGSSESTAIKVMFEANRLGQKNGKGFFRYVPDKKGAPKKEVDPEVPAILAGLVRQDHSAAISDQDIVDRMMLPMIIECSRCLEDAIVNTPVEMDLALIYGLGFPSFRGGALRHADSVGLKALCQRAEAFRSLGKLYEPTAQMKQLAEAGRGFHEEK